MDLPTVWFLLWGLLWAVYFVTDGFDLGIGVLLPFLGKNDAERSMMINAAGPLWDGNEVWLITAGGVTFAAFPKTYAVMFSALYSPLMLVLFALILRGVSFEFRGKVSNSAWRTLWDGCAFVGSLVPALLLGVAFANIFRGIPITADGAYEGTILTLLNPYGLAGGVLFLAFFLVHGALWLYLKTDGELRERAVASARALWWVLLAAAVVFLCAGIWATPLYVNYTAHPVLFVVIAITVAALLGVKRYLALGAYWKAWFSSAVTIVGATFYGIIGLYPNMLPSSLDPAYSVTVHGAASSPKTLTIMFVLALIFTPVVLAYQFWAYKLFRGRLTHEDMGYEEAY